MSGAAAALRFQLAAARLLDSANLAAEADRGNPSPQNVRPLTQVLVDAAGDLHRSFAPTAPAPTRVVPRDARGDDNAGGRGTLWAAIIALEDAIAQATESFEVRSASEGAASIESIERRLQQFMDLKRARGRPRAG